MPSTLRAIRKQAGAGLSSRCSRGTQRKCRCSHSSRVSRPWRSRQRPAGAAGPRAGDPRRSQAQHDTVLAQPALAYGGVQERHPDQASHGFPGSSTIRHRRGSGLSPASGGCAMDSGPAVDSVMGEPPGVIPQTFADHAMRGSNRAWRGPRRLFDKDCMAPDNARIDMILLTLSQSMVGLLTLCRCYKTVRLCEKACRLRVEARNGVPLRGDEGSGRPMRIGYKKSDLNENCRRMVVCGCPVVSRLLRTFRLVRCCPGCCTDSRLPVKSLGMQTVFQIMTTS